MEFYWHDHQTKELGNPAIEQRAVNDLNDRIPHWFKLLERFAPSTRTLLEIGCAHGGFLGYCRDRGITDVTGIEVDPETCEFARRKFDLSQVFAGLFPDVELPRDKYDTIVSFDVLEHLTDPIRALCGIARLMRPDSICILQTPCFTNQRSNWRHFHGPEHVFLFNTGSAIQLLRTAGLETMRVLPGYFPEDMFLIARLQPPVRDIIYIRPDSVGDALLAAPTIPLIAESYLGARITLFCQERVAPLWEKCPHVHQLITFDNDRAVENEAYRLGVLERIRSLKADLCLSAMQSRTVCSDYFTILSEAAQRIGLQGDLSNIAPHEREQTDRGYTRLMASAGAWKPELERHRDFLRGLGIPSRNLQPMVWTGPEDVADAEELFRAHRLDPGHTIAMFAGAQVDLRNVNQLGAALADIVTRENLRVVALGSQAEGDVNRSNLAQLPGDHVDLSGQTSLRVAAEILRRCKLAVGTETGLAHLACAVKTKNVIILGGGHFGRFMPYSPLTTIACLPIQCYGCNWQCRYQRVHCVADVDHRVVREAIGAALAETSDRPRIFAQDQRNWSGGATRPRWNWFHDSLNRHDVDVSMVQIGAEDQVRTVPLTWPQRHRQPIVGPVQAQRRAAAIACLQTPLANLPAMFTARLAPLLASQDMPAQPAAPDEAIVLDEILAGLARTDADPFMPYYRGLSLLYLYENETPPLAISQLPPWLEPFYTRAP
jgi:ADP-heptose:LPS heptosyltransferase